MNLNYHLDRQQAKTKVEIVTPVFLQQKKGGALLFRERGMRRFKSSKQAQNFLSTHAEVRNLFNLGRHLVNADHYRHDREVAFAFLAEELA